MKTWFKIGLISGFVAFLIAVFVLSSFNLDIFNNSEGEEVPGLGFFYGLIFVNISFFTGIIVGVLSEKKSEDKSDYYSKIFLIFFNGLSFFLVMGFGFSLQVWKISFSDSYMWYSILGFFLFGIVFMLLIYALIRKKILPK